MLLLDKLKEALYDAVSRTVPEKEVGVAFSGGVDSTLLAKICRGLGKKVTLVTVGFSGSHDIGFSRVISAKLGMRQEIAEIAPDDFEENLRLVRGAVKCENTSHIENCIAYFYIARLAEQKGLHTILSANGCDELFCGYNGYRAACGGGEAAVMELMGQKIANELTLVGEIASVAGRFSVAVRQPFLSPEFIEFAKTIPVNQKIKGPDDVMRKHILRQAALSIGVPEESAMKPKKALQYGSLIHKHFKKIGSRSYNPSPGPSQ